MKMKSMGVKIGNYPIASEKTIEKVRYPSISVNSDQVEGLGDMKIGDKVYLVAECELESIEKGKSYDDKEGFRASLCLKKAAVKIDEDEEEPKTIEAAFDSAAKKARS